ncbi:MAG: hypothetical protein M1838_004460 [Thelocarpon superellum]|nr:MAG: hypothetical protein M1838_004460 [Thelocarpon superellum]
MSTSPESFAVATTVTPTSSHAYAAHFPAEWCIGAVPHGGYVTSVFQQVASTHFATALAAQQQPHTISLHLEFLRRTVVGPADFEVRDAKAGRQTSNVQITLRQGGREVVTGFLIQSNMRLDFGLSLPTDYALHPAPIAADISKLRRDADPEWARMPDVPFSKFRKATQRVHFFTPRHGQRHASITDQWLSFVNGERFTNESIGFVADMFLQPVENYRPSKGSSDSETSGWVRHWYPTLVLNLEPKKLLPDEGVEFLFVRARSKQIQKGRMDLEVTVLDETGDIVALSNHLALIMSASRNTQGRLDSIL